MAKRKQRTKRRSNKPGSPRCGLCGKTRNLTEINTSNRIADIKAFAQEIRNHLDLVDTDFETKRQIINALDVRAVLILEEGQKSVRISCVLNPTAPPAQLSYCTN